MISCYFVKPDNIDVNDLIINVRTVFIGMFLLGVIFLSVGISISSILKSDKGSISLSIGIFFVTYVLGIVGKLKEDFEFLKYFSPFDYFAPGELLKDGFDTRFVLIGLCIVFVSIVSSYLIYERKDMNI